MLLNLIVFLMLICLLLQGWDLSQEPARVDGKLFFLPYSLAIHDGTCRDNILAVETAARILKNWQKLAKDKNS